MPIVGGVHWAPLLLVFLMLRLRNIAQRLISERLKLTSLPCQNGNLAENGILRFLFSSAHIFSFETLD